MWLNEKILITEVIFKKWTQAVFFFNKELVIYFIHFTLLSHFFWLTFLFRPGHSLPLLCGSGPRGASAAPAVCFSFRDTGTTTAWPPRSPPVQTPPTMLYFSWRQCPRMSQNCCCCSPTRQQVPRSTRSSQYQGRRARLREHITHTGNHSFQRVHCCRYCCDELCLWRGGSMADSHWNSSPQFPNFWHISSAEVKNCRERSMWGWTQAEKLHKKSLKTETCTWHNSLIHATKSTLHRNAPLEV